MNLFSNPFSCFSKKSKMAADKEVAKGKKISLSKKKGTDGGEGSGSKEIMEKFEGFKRFDSAEDYSDHYYRKNDSPANSLSKNRIKRILKEWKILENDLPETIYVRVYESKIDIMRAAIIGAQGTPYQSGVFFFDIFFPENYPNVPPLVYYHSRGLAINPNLYPNGRVCLSILNTWWGRGVEKWVPGVSTILQVLVSIQGLVLNTKPFYNEHPGLRWWLSSMRTSEKGSMRYNENVFILCLKTMVYTIKAPPKHFEDLVMGHFYKHGSDIMAACEAYRNGTHVGSEGSTAPNLDGVVKMECSKRFRRSLGHQMKTLRKVFAEVGLQTSL